LQIAAAEGRGALPFPAATGVNCGTVIAGFLGVGGKRDFTVIGDAVNVTARIESLAETMRYQRVLASEKIIDMLPRDILAREHGEVELKGKSQPMKLYQLTAANGSVLIG
jgi:class 3 adenylate cyclase